MDALEIITTLALVCVLLLHAMQPRRGLRLEDVNEGGNFRR